MLGAICGDIVGSVYEGDPIKRKEFELFNQYKYYTDDSVMTVAIADALLSVIEYTEDNVKTAVIERMKYFGRKHDNAGYGGGFRRWLFLEDEGDKPYGSFGNGSAMRASSVGWLFDTLEETEQVAGWTAEVTHNHPEGVKGAKATAAVIFLARTGHSKKEIQKYIRENYYPLDLTCDEIRPNYKFDVTCQGTVPPAIEAFLEGNSFEDVIRTAISLGGDSDTLTCIAGSMAEAAYGIPTEFVDTIKSYLCKDLAHVVDKFYLDKRVQKSIANYASIFASPQDEEISFCSKPKKEEEIHAIQGEIKPTQSFFDKIKLFLCRLR